MATKTAMQELKDKLQVVVDEMKDAVHGTNPYGYRAAMQNVIKDIEQINGINSKECIVVYKDSDEIWDGWKDGWFVPLSEGNLNTALNKMINYDS